MKDIFTNRDVLQTGEKRSLSPEEARKDAIDRFVGAATAALSYDSEVVHQADLAPFMGGHVEDVFMERRRQQLGLEQAVQPVAPIESVVAVEMDNDEYLDRLASEPTPSHVTKISPGARNAVMDSTVDFTNGYQEAA